MGSCKGGGEGVSCHGSTEWGSWLGDVWLTAKGRPRGKSVLAEELECMKARGEPGRIQGHLDPVVISSPGWRCDIVVYNRK